jgi:hypothetical protein
MVANANTPVGRWMATNNPSAIGWIDLGFNVGSNSVRRGGVAPIAFARHEIALAAVRNRLRILGKSDSETADLEAQPTQRIDPVAIVPAPIAGTVMQR